VTLLARLTDASGLAVLVDPARTTARDAEELGARAAGEGVAVLLVGTSFGQGTDAAATVCALRKAAPGVPLVLFPASAADLVPGVDGVLMLSLVSGRNAQYLIEEHVRAVPFFDRHPEVESIATAYCLVDGGCVTAVEATSQTRPLPADKPEFVHAHVSAAARLGMRATYLDAGSGARRPVGAPLIHAARAVSAGPLFVGGGIRTTEQVRVARDAGADFVVVGTLFEQSGARAVGALVNAAHT
jgi:putative glycerol-1-phosphate prenyltransferase